LGLGWPISATGLQVTITKRHAPIAALVPYCGKGLTITKRDKPIASVLGDCRVK
jgi:antitoxin (DNA-binding transcriptional repressor) of toxin-antitoxin stability system